MYVCMYVYLDSIYIFKISFCYLAFMCLCLCPVQQNVLKLILLWTEPYMEQTLLILSYRPSQV